MNTLTLLAPAGLFALAALAVPVLIHLISNSRGRRVLVGNIALYRQAQRRRVTEFRLVQWLLLLLRLLLLAFAALLLAGLARPGLETLDGATAYVTPGWLSGRSDLSALSSFDQAFLLDAGTTEVDTSNGTPTSGQTDASTGVDVDVASRLVERLATVQHGGEIHVFATRQVGEFPVRLPGFGNGSTITWHLDAPGDTGPGADPSRPSLAVHLAKAESRTADADVFMAALETIASNRSVDLAITRGSVDDLSTAWNAVDDPATRRALLWLGEGPAPEAFGADVVLEDQSTRGPILQPAVFPGPGASPFLARPTEADPASEVFWRTDLGAPLLVGLQSDEARRLRYLDRLGVDADGPAFKAGFPDALLRLLLGEANFQAGFAMAEADPLPALTRDDVEPDRPVRSLSPWLALAMALLFGLERWLSERPRPQENLTAKDGQP